MGRRQLSFRASKVNAAPLDARNRCVRRTINGATTYLYYDSWNLVEEQAPGNALVMRYIHGAQTDELVKASSDGQIDNDMYYLQDAIGSTVALVDIYGGLLETYSYDVFGKPNMTSSLGNRFLFTGREYLSELGLYDYRNRFYSPTLGRFLQTDALRLQKDVNLYRYVKNSPTQFTDPNGLCCEEERQEYANATDRLTEATDALNSSRNDVAEAQSDVHWWEARAAFLASSAVWTCRSIKGPPIVAIPAAILCAGAVASATWAAEKLDEANEKLNAANADLADSQQEHDEAKEEVENWKDALESCENAQQN